MRIRSITATLATAAALSLAVLPGSTGGAFAASRSADSSGCGSVRACAQLVLKTLNSERAHFSLQPLKLTMIQTAGRAACPGSMGHSEAMARTGNIWHENSKFPQASFPNNICVRYTAIGENVGQADYGTVEQDVQAINNLMMAEPHDRATCASTDTHACNILNPAFHQVGIGVYHVDGATWLTEDFVN